MLLKLFGRRGDEDALFAEQGRPRPRPRRPDLADHPDLLRRHAAGAGAGHRPRLRRRRPPRHRRAALTVGTLLALGTLLLRLLGPLQGLSNVRIDVMTALVSFERVFEVLDLPSMIQEKPDAVALPPPASPPRVRPRRVHLPAGRRDLAGLAGVGRPHRVAATPARCSTTSPSPPSPARWSRWSARPGAGKTTVTHLVARLYDADAGAVRVGGHDVRDVTLQSLEDVVGYVTQDAHMFHDTIRANLLYARPGRHRRRDLGRPARRRRSRALVAALPDGLDTVVGDRGYRLSGGERQRLAIARLLLKAPVDRRARRGHRPPRQRVRGRRPAGARRRARGPHVAGDRAPALHRPQRRPDPGPRRRPDRAVRHPRRAARRRAASTPTSTAPSSSRTSPRDRLTRRGRRTAP